MIIELTRLFLETGLVVPPGKQRLEACDAACPGLLVEKRATENSIPTYYLRYKRNGKTAYDRLGTIRELTLTQARKLATQKKVEHAQEVKLPVEAKPTLDAMILDTFMHDHYMPHARIHKRSHVRDDQLYRIRIKPKFGDTPLKDITRYAVQQFQNELATAGLSPASQDHHIKLFRHALNMAVQWEFLEKNVLKGIRLLNEDNQLHDVADDQQLKRLVEILKTDENRPVCNILMFLLSTGARLNEALQARWDQVDLERGIWTIPAANAKSKRARSVPLNDSALYVLAEAGKVKKFDSIFANPETGKPYTTITRVWYRLRKLAGITKMRIHSCRHQFASLLVSSGRSLYDVQVLLGHADPRVSQRYAKLSMPALQAAANTASIIVPKVQLAPIPSRASPEPAEGVLTQPATTTSPQQQTPKEMPTDNVLPFPKAA
jgi:integrase